MFVAWMFLLLFSDMLVFVSILYLESLVLYRFQNTFKSDLYTNFTVIEISCFIKGSLLHVPMLYYLFLLHNCLTRALCTNTFVRHCIYFKLLLLLIAYTITTEKFSWYDCYFLCSIIIVLHADSGQKKV